MTSNSYQMWMTFNGGSEKLRYPVLPQRINVRHGMANTSVAIQGLGEVVIMQDPTAVVINFSSFFPSRPFPGVQFENLTSPIALVEKIVKWKTSDRPVQFMVTGVNLNMYFTIEAFSYFEQGGDVGDLHYSITLKEYKEVAIRQVAVRNQVATIPEPAPERVDNRVQDPTHTVAKGDNLTAIARAKLGDGSRWPEIFEMNRGIISNPNLIFPGQELRLPAA